MPDAPREKGTRRQALDDCEPEVAGRGSGVSDDAGSQTREYFTRSVRREKGDFGLVLYHIGGKIFKAEKSVRACN